MQREVHKLTNARYHIRRTLFGILEALRYPVLMTKMIQLGS